jgi:hypothetical protein
MSVSMVRYLVERFRIGPGKECAQVVPTRLRYVVETSNAPRPACPTSRPQRAQRKNDIRE